VSDEQDSWTYNYFNYFTEVEEHFQRARGTGLFLLSPLDWALVEAWKNAGVPLAAVLRGIDAAFEKWRGRKSKVQAVNSLAYCAQAVLSEAQVMAGLEQPRTKKPVEAPFELEELRGYLRRNAEALRKAGFDEIAASLERLREQAEEHYQDLEQLEQRLTALEEKMVAQARGRQSEEELFQARRSLDLELRPYRGKITADQLALLEKQYLERRLLDSLNLPRLSLFYLH
jgi:flagellar motility protein MotE (MotC chaperone)